MRLSPLPMLAVAALLTGAPPAGLALTRPGPAVAGQTPVAGAPGLGDPFFPLAGNGGYDVSHYGLRLAYRPDTRVLTGSVTVSATTTESLYRFDLDLRGFTIGGLTVDGEPAGYTRAGQELAITPAEPLRRGQRFTVTIDYSGVPATVTDPDGSIEGWIPTDDGALVVAEPQGAPGWYPVNDTPRDKATYDFAVTVPSGLTALANGVLVRRAAAGGQSSFWWREGDPMAPYLATTAVGRFTLTTSTVDGVPAYVAVDPTLTDRSGLAQLPSIVDFYSSVFGRYPFDAVGAIVDNAPSVGYALETQTKPAFDRVPDESTLAHELAHQWYGDAVTLTTWPDIWLHEGLATWAEWLWSEHRGRTSAHDTFTRLYATPATDTPFWAPPPATPGQPANLFARPVYQRGALTLQALREKVGDPAFFRVMRDWVARYRYGNATTADFIRLAERDTGRALGHFLRRLAVPAGPADRLVTVDGPVSRPPGRRSVGSRLATDCSPTGTPGDSGRGILIGAGNRPSWSAPSGPDRGGGVTWTRAVSTLRYVQALTLLLYGVLLLPVRFASATLRDNLIGNAVLVLPTLVVAARGIRYRRDRRWSLCVAAGMAAFTAGNLVYVNHVQYLDPAPYPSVADLGYLALYPPVAIGLVLLARGGAGRRQRGVLLDGLVTTLGAGSFAGAFVVAPLVAASTRSANGGWSQIAVGAAYPVADAAIVAMVVGVFVLRGGRPGFYGWIGAGLAIFALADTLYVYRVANGTYSVGTFLDGLWAIGLNVVAVGVWRPRRDHGGDRVTSVWMLAAPLASVVLALGVLVRASLSPTPLPVVLLAAATMLAATGRVVDGFRTVLDFARVRAEARTDELTGLGNRRLLYEAIDAEIPALRTGNGLYLVLIDLDRFKEVNDSLGHAAGDEVLRAVARRLAAATDPGDVLVRLGGDEFAVLLTRRDRGFDELAAAGRLTAAITQPIMVAGLSLQVGASTGIAGVPFDALDRTDLMRHADVAMYDAKANRTGTARYDAARDDNGRERLELLWDLRAALADDPGQLVVHYQPKCRLDGRVLGAEALVRWQHPVRGLLAPDTFVPVAENNSLMPTLTRHVLAAALAQCRRWRETDPRAMVAVNLSVSSLLDENLIADTLTAIAVAGVPPEALTLEITESMIMLDPDRSQRTLRALHGHGIHLSVDDYGTGQCSLAYLRDLPIQELKLDRSFVRDIATQPRDAAIVRSTIDLAHSLGLTMVAEGVESAEAAELLRAMGCDLAQGWWFGRATMAAATLAGQALPHGSPVGTAHRP